MRLIVLLFLFSSITVYAETFKGIYGPEFTFGLTHGTQQNVPAQIVEFFNKAKTHLVYGQTNEDRFVPWSFDKRSGFMSPNGWWFTFMDDPGVLEVQMKPMTVEDFTKYASDIQDAVFVTAANSGLYPMEYLGGGHINIGMSSFKNNPLLLRNFLVDFWNHNEISLGCLSYNTNSAIPLCLQDDKYTRTIQGILNRFDKLMRLNEINPTVLTMQLIKDLNTTRTKSVDEYRAQWGKPNENRGRHTDLTLSQIAGLENGRIEIRAIRPQKSIYRWIKQIELLDARINYLAKLNSPIPFSPIVPIRMPKTGNEIRRATLNPPIEVQDALKAYYLYITESGLKWEDYKEDLWPQWQTSGEVEQFENSDWFRAQSVNQIKNCKDLL